MNQHETAACAAYQLIIDAHNLDQNQREDLGAARRQFTLVERELADLEAARADASADARDTPPWYQDMIRKRDRLGGEIVEARGRGDHGVADRLLGTQARVEFELSKHAHLAHAPKDIVAGKVFRVRAKLAQLRGRIANLQQDIAQAYAEYERVDAERLVKEDEDAERVAFDKEEARARDARFRAWRQRTPAPPTAEGGAS